jgi:monoamine oxidase
MPLTRRHFLEQLAAVGGATVACESMTALGLLARPSQAPFELRGQVDGVRVVVLGAGLAGLTVAYELSKRGYKVQVLEARPRPGGRAHTVRRGTTGEEDGPPQVCTFDEGQYFNPGAMRIPHHHAAVMEYCRELAVAIEPFCNRCDGAYVYQAQSSALAGRRIRQREARTDLDGYVAELLAKAITQDRLDEPLTSDDRDNLVAYLREAGALSERGRYEGSPRRGSGGRPLALADLLGSRAGLYLHDDFNYQPTLFQIAGGTDRLPAAFAARLREKIVYRAAVREIRQGESGVSVIFADQNGRMRKVDAAYCACTIPLPVLAAIEADFAPDFKRAIASFTYASAGKMGLQFRRRFWEEDDAIYGGASRTDQDIAQIIYPSTGFNGRKGVLIGYYIQDGRARLIGERTPAERLAVALEQGERIHAQYRKEFESAFSVAWHRVKWNGGSWASFGGSARREYQPILLKPDGRVYLAGDHVSNINAWMQGAFESGRSVATQIHLRTMREGRPRARQAESQISII